MRGVRVTHYKVSRRERRSVRSAGSGGTCGAGYDGDPEQFAGGAGDGRRGR